MDEIRGNGLLKRLAGDIFPQVLTIYDDEASAEAERFGVHPIVKRLDQQCCDGTEAIFWLPAGPRLFEPTFVRRALVVVVFSFCGMVGAGSAGLNVRSTVCFWAVVYRGASLLATSGR